MDPRLSVRRDRGCATVSARRTHRASGRHCSCSSGRWILAACVGSSSRPIDVGREKCSADRVLTAGKAIFRLPGAVSMDNVPVAVSIRSGSNAVPATIRAAVVINTTRLPSGARSAASIVAAGRRAALPRETIAQARNRIVSEATPRGGRSSCRSQRPSRGGAAVCATTIAPITPTAYGPATEQCWRSTADPAHS
jgi:hypothetical protein